MKISVRSAVLITTVVLVSLTVLSRFNVTFSLIFFGTVIGQVLLIWLVLKVLRDDYTTDNTFDDWYEDVSVKSNE